MCRLSVSFGLKRDETQRVLGYSQGLHNGLWFMYQKIISWFLFGLFLLCSVESVAIDVEIDSAVLQDYKRIALVIGNEDYQSKHLSYPVEDAQAIKAFLISKNFQEDNIFYAENATLTTMKNEIAKFTARVREAKKSIAFVYYSGHGSQVKSIRYDGERTDYLIPIDNASINSITDLDYGSISLNRLLSQLHEFNHGLNIVLMDACRDKSFTKSTSRSVEPISAEGVFVAYATASGYTASDNSLFRKSFIKHANQPLTLREIFGKVKDELYRTSQRAVTQDRVVGNFYFTGNEGDRTEVLNENFYHAKAYENQALLAFSEGDKSKDITEYRKAWLYGLEAMKLKMPEGKMALKLSTLSQLTSLSVNALMPEKYSPPAFLDIGTEITALTYSTRGSVLASGLEDGVIKLWDTKTGRLKKTFKAHKHKITALSYNPNSSTLVSTGTEDGMIKFWDVKTGLSKQIFKESEEGVTALSYNPDGRILAAGSEDGTIKFWDVKTGQLKQTFKGGEAEISAISYSPDGRILAFGSPLNRRIKFYNVKKGQVEYMFKGSEEEINALSYSSNGQLLASGSEDGVIKLWNAKTGQLKRILKDGVSGISAISYSPDGRVVASGEERAIKLWNVKTSELKQILKERDKKQDKALSYSPDGSVFATGSEKGVIQLWDVKTGQLKQTLKGHKAWVIVLRYNLDGSVLASGSRDGIITLWDVKTGELKQKLKGHKNRIITLSYSPDGRVLASGSRDKMIKLWDTKTGQLKQTFKGHEGGVFVLNYSPDGDVLASGSGDQTIKLWDVKTGELKQTLKGHSGEVIALSYHPDGKTIASGSMDKTIKFWDVKTGQLRQTLKGHNDWVSGISYSRDGSALASGSWDGMIKLWDVETGQLKQVFKSDKQSVTALSYSSEGNVFISLGGNTIRFWDADVGELKQIMFKGYKKDNVLGNNIINLSYSSDSRLLASEVRNGKVNLWDSKGQWKQTLVNPMSEKRHTILPNISDNNVLLPKLPDGAITSYNPNMSIIAFGLRGGMINLWDMRKGKLKQIIKGNKEEEITALSYRPDGKILASGSEDGMVSLWTSSILKTQTLFYKYNPKQVSAALQSLWEMGLDDDKLTFVHKVRTPNLYPIQGRYYADTQFLPLLDYPSEGKKKSDLLIQWLEDRKAYQN